MLPWAAGDFAPLEAGVVDEDTYVEQGRDLERAYSHQVIEYVLGTLQPNTDLAMVGYPFTDEVSHQFLGLVRPTDADGDQNPCYDITPLFSDATSASARPRRTVSAIREGYIRSAYVDADEKLALARSLMGGNPTTFAGSDHGFAPQWYAVNANAVLKNATVTAASDPTHTPVSLHASNASASNCSATDDRHHEGLLGRRHHPDLHQRRPPEQHRESNLPDLRRGPCRGQGRVRGRHRPGQPRQAGDPPDHGQGGAPQRRRLRLAPPEPEWRRGRRDPAAVPVGRRHSRQGHRLSHFFGQHGYLPDMVDLANNINMHGTFVMAGPGVKHKDKVKSLRAVDMAPTISLLMGIPGPMNARGAILYDLLKHGEKLHEVTILDISDWHGQLTPLPDAADTIPAVPLTYPIGGAAYLKTWFDTYTAEAQRSGGKKAPVITMAAGDSIGATPPLSNFFGDRPAIEIMNMMGVDIDGLGNHNFDYGADYFREELVPLSNHPFVSANVVDANGKTPTEWKPSHTFNFPGGIKVAIVGFSNDDIPALTKPGSLDPFHIANSLAAVNAEAAKVEQEGRRRRGHRPPRGDGRDPDGPDRSAPRPRQWRRPTSTSSSATTPTSRWLDRRTERRPRHREPQQGPALHADPHRHRRRQGRRRLPDGRLPSAVDHRRHAGSGDPGRDRPS